MEAPVSPLCDRKAPDELEHYHKEGAPELRVTARLISVSPWRFSHGTHWHRAKTIACDAYFGNDGVSVLSRIGIERRLTSSLLEGIDDSRGLVPRLMEVCFSTGFDPGHSTLNGT